MQHGGVGSLVKAAAGGDATAWRALVENFSSLIWSIARGHRLGSADAADVFQTVWLRLAEHLSRIENPDHVGAWLATTAKRESLRVARSGARTVPMDDKALADLTPAGEPSPEQVVLRAEQTRLDAQLARRMWGIFGEMSSRCQQLLRVLMATPAPSYAQVAAALDLPLGSIGPTRARCLQQLRIRLVSEVSGTGSPAHKNEREK
ncbi:MAG TPA: sigma-70 family RNA polymerase sigma factor [Streptosporangiaceae bacterium]|nr:sigma-70 family RNA polymerase sigma factor [Streptosporangiaceae bacterium]